MIFPSCKLITKFTAASLIAVAAILLILIAAPCHADDIEDSERRRLEEKQKIEQEIKRNQIIIQRLQESLEDQQEGIEHTQLREKGVLEELQELDQNLWKMAERLRQLDERMTQQQELIATKETELEEVRKVSEKVQLHMQNRIGAYYKLGKIDLINITFSTRTFPELLRFHDSFQTVIAYDQDLMKRYRNTIEDLEGAKTALTLEEGLLEEFISQANKEKQDILTARQNKNSLLNRVKTQALLHEQAIQEIEKAKKDLSSTLSAMKKKEILYDQGFLVNKGKHIAPVEGNIIRLFNQEAVNQFGITRKDPGIAISAPDGSKIHAVYDGDVIYSGYLKGYGNTIILDHGYDYFTITSRIERMLVTKGTKVKRNDIIGIMGSTATISDEGLYFEVRKKETPMDPLQWLDPKNLKFKDDTIR